jgi:hypothetical protein
VQDTYTASDYFKILDLPSDSSVEDIKKAYRKKARLFHPDINQAPDAKDLFICATEAYEFLIAYHEKIRSDGQAYNRSQTRAAAYARTPYRKFKNTKFYKTTRIFDGTAIIFSFGIAIMVMVYTIYGYIFRLRHPVPGFEKPSVFTFIMLLLLGMTFFSISFIYMKAYLDTYRKNKKK